MGKPRSMHGEYTEYPPEMQQAPARRVYEILVGKRAGRLTLRRQRKHWSDHDSSAMGVSAGNQAFLQSARIDLDKACETARKKTVGDSGGAASVLMGSWREALRLTLDTSKRGSTQLCPR